jgi:hypothetical protein
MRWLWPALISILSACIFGVLLGYAFEGMAVGIIDDWVPHEAYWVAWAAGVSTFAICVYARIQRPTSGIRETLCRRCGYNLRGISEPRCPECGERI